MKRTPYVDNLPLLHQGKVRDTYATNTPGTRLIVATDGVSTHNVAHLSPIPMKGWTLNATSIFWATEVFPDIPTHILAYGLGIYEFLPKDRVYAPDLHLRAIVARDLRMDPYEYILRARMAGSLWNNYYKLGLPNPYGLDLPEGLQLMSPFEQVQFTPTDKSETDDPVESDVIEGAYPDSVAMMREVYRRGREFAMNRDFDIIDFKGEAGRDSDGILRLGDECLTGDCCRFVPKDQIVIGKEPPWADKEFVRQAAIAQWAGDKNRPPLEFSPEVISATSDLYLGLFEQLAGRSLAIYQQHLLCT